MTLKPDRKGPAPSPALRVSRKARPEHTEVTSLHSTTKPRKKLKTTETPSTQGGRWGSVPDTKVATHERSRKHDPT